MTSVRVTSHFRVLKASVGATVLLLPVGCIAAEVWVVTDRAHPVRMVPGARVIELDAAARIEAEISAGLPADADQAAALVAKRVADGGVTLQRRLASAYQDIADAWSAAVTKIPAVVVDRRFVVYGDSDVARAVKEVERYRTENR